MPVEFKGVFGVDRCAIGVDYAVHPDYRGQGISKTLSKGVNRVLFEAGYRFSYSITSSPRVISRIIKDHLCFNGEVLNYVRVVDVDRQLDAMPMDRGWMMKTGYKVLKGLNGVRNALRPKVSRGCVSVVEDTGFGVEAEALWERVSPHYGFMLKRDPGYLSWRYCDPRAGNYEVYLAEKGDEILGYAVSGVNGIREDYPVGYVADLVAGGGRGDVSGALLAHMVDRLNEERINIVLGLAVKGNKVESAYTGSGFLDSRERLELFITPVGGSRISETIKGFKPERVQYCWGDHDSLPTSLARN
jgi:hypothetical protein